MNWKERNEYIKYFEETMCAICRSKFCRKKIRIKRRNEVTSIKCNEYNQRYKNRYK